MAKFSIGHRRLLDRCVAALFLGLVVGFQNVDSLVVKRSFWHLAPPEGSTLGMIQIRPKGWRLNPFDWRSRSTRKATIAADTFLCSEGGDEKKERTILTKQRSKVSATTFNLIKAVVGSGVLALPAGVAAISDNKKSLFPAVALMSFLGALSAYTFCLYGRMVHSSQAHSLGELWEKEKGKKTAWIISVASLTFCFGAALSYSILLGDTFSALAQSVGLSGLAAARYMWILLITTIVIFPLCNLQSLLALAPLSIIGVFAILVTTIFLGWRCPSINASSPYAMASGGALLQTLSSHQMPQFNTLSKGFGSPSSMILGGMAASAYLGHFSAPAFYHSVRSTEEEDTDVDHTVPNTNPLRDYLLVTFGGFGSVTLINCLVMAFGFLTFGSSCSGVILNNFSTTDVGASLCRLLMAICVMGGYPFLISACRGEILELWKRKSPRGLTRRLEKTVTTLLLTTLTGLSLVMKNAGFVIGLNGALMGSAIVYIFPSLLFLEHTKSLVRLTKRLRLERWLCRLLIGFGFAAAFVGGSVSIIDNYFPHLLT